MDIINKIISDISDKDFTPPQHICDNTNDCLCEREISYKMKKKVFQQNKAQLEKIFEGMKALNYNTEKRKEIEWYADEIQHKYRQTNDNLHCIYKKIKRADKIKYQNKEYSFIKKTSTEQKIDYSEFKEKLSPSEFWVYSINYYNDDFRFRIKFEDNNPISLDVELEIDGEPSAKEVKDQFIDNLNKFGKLIQNIIDSKDQIE